MSKYKIFANTKHDYVIEIEADSIEQARAEAMYSPVTNWNNRGYDFTIISIEEAK
jgi:hypothetical protein